MKDSERGPNATPSDPFLVGKVYTAAEAARLAGTTHATVRRWITGYYQPGHQMDPVFGKSAEAGPAGPFQVSFLQLVELVVVARFRRGSAGQAQLGLDRLRHAHGYVRKAFDVAYPFATWKLREFGGHILH